MRGKDITKLTAVMEILIQEKQLDPKHRNHKLQGKYEGSWECHVESDWLLIYEKNKIEIYFSRTGTHSDLF